MGDRRPRDRGRAFAAVLTIKAAAGASSSPFAIAARGRRVARPSSGGLARERGCDGVVERPDVVSTTGRSSAPTTSCDATTIVVPRCAPQYHDET
jgi:hypothetical protein